MASPGTLSSNGATINEVAEANYIPLHKAIVRGDWDKAQEFFNDKAILTANLDNIGNSALHLAGSTYRNPRFVENLLKEINPASLPTLVNYKGYTSPHHAAGVGYTEAAKMLVEKNPCLLFISGGEHDLPVFRALFSYQEITFRYLLEVSKLHIGLSQLDNSYQNPFEGKHGSFLLGQVLGHGFLDIAYELICEYPNSAIRGLD